MFKKIILVLLVVSFVSNSQTIQVDFSGNWSNEEVVLTYHNYIEELVIDSFSTEKHSVLLPKTMPSTLLKLKVIAQDNLAFEKIIIWEGNTIKLQLNKTLNTINVEWLEEGINSSVESYASINDSLTKRIGVIQTIAQQYSDTLSDFYKTVRLERKKSIDAVKKNNDYYQNKFKNTPAQAYIESLNITIPDPKRDFKEQLIQMQQNFFKHLELLDKSVRNSYIFKDKIDEYLMLIKNISYEKSGIDENKMISYLVLLFDEINSDEAAVYSSAEYIRNVVHKSGLEKIEAYIDINYIATSCNVEDDEALQKRLDNYKRLAVGNLAPEIVSISSTDKKINLQNLSTKYTLVLFWASWCGHCKETLPEIYNYLEKNTETTVIAIGLDADENSWRQEIKNYPNWLHIRGSKQWDDPIANEYAVYATPTIYVLDEDKKILGKCKNLNEINELLGK